MSNLSSRWVFVVLALLYLLLLVRPIHDVDIFWQVKYGQLAWQNGGLVPTEPFLAGREETNAIPVAWLGQIVEALLLKTDSWKLLHVIDAAIWLAGLALAIGRLRNHSTLVVIVALAVGYLAAVPFQSVRPQSFAVLCFGGLVRLALSPLSTKRMLLIGIPLLFLWQNLHPSVVVGAIYLALVTASRLIGTIFRREPKPWATVALMVAAGVSISLTPAGPAILAISRANADLSVFLRVSEWLPMSAPENRSALAGPAIAMLVLIVAALRNRKPIDWPVVLPALAFAVMTLFAFRFTVFFGVVLIPALISLLLPVENHAVPVPFRHTMIFAILVAFITAVIAFFLPVRFATYYPIEAIEELKAASVSGPIYCHHSWGSLLPYYGHPGWKPTHDGRYYLHTKETWQRYREASQGLIPVDEIVAAFKPVAFFLRPGEDEGLIDLLKRDRNWWLWHADGNAAIFVARR